VGSLVENARAIAAGEASSRELVERTLRDAERTQPALNAFTMLFLERAMEDAARADAAIARGDAIGPLHGVPFAVKDAYDVGGHVTSACSRAYADRVASSDAPAVAALRRAGAVLIGKTNMHELAFGDTSSISSFGAVNNPWDVARSPGGSSGGSGAAVAARIVPLAMAEDTGGSIRTPASVCGVTGLKPTYGVVPTEGLLPLSHTLDTAGPIAVDAIDVAATFSVFVDHRVDDQRSLEAVRVGIPEGYFFRVVDPDVEHAVREVASVLERLGASVGPVTIEGLDEANRHWINIAMFEFARDHAGLLERLDEVDPWIAAMLQMSVRFTEDDYHESMREKARFTERMASAFRDADLLVAPATRTVAPRHDEENVRVGDVELNAHAGALSQQAFPASLARVPALVVPCGFVRRLPVGAQLIGPRKGEPLLLAAAQLYQRETDWHTRIPPLAA
jgi:aspartyl-tRNA(Asn)/glutamyl-tRNA(Gln) amidotransferase subunit A